MSFHKTAVTFLVLALVAVTSGCWIPLPEETAIVVEVFDAQGGPVDGVSFLLDSAGTIVTGTQLNEGQIFESLTVEGIHTLQLETSSLIDPQGGMGWIPLASQISGELVPLSFGNRPYAGASDVLLVPVNKGEITVVSIYLDDALESPADNQWLTDGSNSSAFRPDNNTDEFQDSPQPMFWWRQDPSLGTTVITTFQLWEDDDTDTRYPLGIVDHVQYGSAMDPSNVSYQAPDWQVPLAGIQRAEASPTANQVFVWSSQANETPVKYDLYYAPTSHWNGSDLESNPVLRDLSGGVTNGSAIRFSVGNGTSNGGLILKNGVPYTYALAARDGSSNLDTVSAGTPRGERIATPREENNLLGDVTGFAITDTTAGGSLSLEFNCQFDDSLRIYVAPGTEFGARPFDPRFIRDEILCTGTPTQYDLYYLLNGITYSVGVEPFDSAGNIGTASSVIAGRPVSNPADSGSPGFLGTPLVVDTAGLGPGEVRLTVAAVADSAAQSPVIRRVYWAPASWTSTEEAMPFFELPAASTYATVLTNIPSGVPYNYVVRAIDSYGNSAIGDTQATLVESDTVGPTWISDDQTFYSTFSYSAGSTVWPLGASWSYDGFALGRDPGQGAGEYVWRVLQENPDRGITRASKLGAFYTYSGYYYASTESSSLDMSQSGSGRPGGGPSPTVAHQNVFSFIESGVLTADVMGTPFDSGDSSGYRQRSAATFSGSLAAGDSAANQLRILYNTDEDGVAVVSQETGGGYLGILRVLAVNKQLPLPTAEPHLQGKEFQLSYFTDAPDDLVTFPIPLFGGGVYFSGTLDEPDYMDPLW